MRNFELLFLIFSVILIVTNCATTSKNGNKQNLAGIDDIYEKWTDDLEVAKGDSIALQQTKEEIGFEVEYLTSFKKDPEKLYTAYLGYQLLGGLHDSIKANDISKLIRKKFPESEQTYNLANEEFYDRIYPVWRDDSLKVIIISELLKKYPKTNWRRTMYQYLTYSLNNLKQIKKLKKTLKNFRKTFPDDYIPYIQTTRYYNYNDIEPEKALEHAEEAYYLSRDYPKIDFIPDMEWNLEKRSAPVKTVAILADILNKQEKYIEAEEVLMEVINSNKLSIDDEVTLSRCYYYLGKSFRGQGENELAINALIQSIILGDSRNFYTPNADSLLRELLLEKDLSEKELLSFVRDHTDYNDVIFTDITEECNLQDISAGRVAWGDFNSDGFQDLLLDGRKLFENIDGKIFINITSETFPDTIRGNGGLWGDLDNDGDLDIVTKDPESVWLNENGIFYEFKEENSLNDNNISTEGMGLGDVDNDGFLDLYLANYEVWNVTGSLPEQDQFFYGDSTGAFFEVTEEAGLLPGDGKKRAGRGVNFGDFDNDTDLDIFVSNYRLQENFLWVNDGSGYFENQARELGVSGVEVEGWWGHTIGSEWADIDNDGDLDLITANLAHPRYIDFSNKTMLYLNSGSPDWKFEDIRRATGIKFEETHSEPAWGDLNNDGYYDLYINDVYEGRRSFLYMNNQDNTFREVTYLAGVRHYNGWGIAFADIDNDGDLDILAAGGKIQLLRNDTPDIGNWLEVEIVGKDHSDAIGTRLSLYNENILLTREIQGGKGTTNQHSLIQHFGLGENEPPFTLKIRYPSGKEESTVIREINRIIEIKE